MMTESPETHKGSLARRMKLSKPTLSLDRTGASRTPKAVQHSVFARLQAAFLPHASSPPLDSLPITLEQPAQPPDPKYIKVRIISWNMNETLPKGDLSTLLGTLPTYSPSEVGDDLKIPGLSIDAQHPYHIVVVAGQECPTLMGLPLGLGGGLKWDRDEDDKRKEKKDKDKVDDKPLTAKSKKDKGKGKDDTLQVDIIPSGAATPKPHSHHTAGWSNILEDYFSRGIGSIEGAKPDVFSPGATDYNSQSSLMLSPSGDRLGRQTSASVPGMANKDASWTFPSGGVIVPKMGPYELLTKERLMGIYLAIYVHRDVKSLVQDYSQSSVAAGLIGGRLGNKGGVAISLKFNGTTFLFMNAHLAAHDDKVALRLSNMTKIKAEMNVDDFLDSKDERKTATDITDRFDHAFLFGDLNFRLDITRKHADWLMLQKKYSEAQEFDQLRGIMHGLGSHTFQGFHEAPIDFPPTFKYDVMRTLKDSKRRSSSKRSRHRRKRKDLTEVGEVTEDQNSQIWDRDRDTLEQVPHSAVTQEEGEAESIISRSASYYSRNTRERGDGSHDSDSDSDALSKETKNGNNLNGDKVAEIAQKARTGVLFAALKAKEKWTAAFGSTSSLPSPLKTPGVSGAPITPRSAKVIKPLPSEPQVQAPTQTQKPSSDISRSKTVKLSPPPLRKAHEENSGNANPIANATINTTVPLPSPLPPLPPLPPVEYLQNVPRSVPVTPSISRQTTSLDLPRKPTNDSQSSVTLLRSVTTKSPSASKTFLAVQDAAQDAEQSLEIEDKGVYDTSSKQRVPSWCDRILFKTTIEIPPTPIEKEPPIFGSPPPSGRRSTPKVAAFFNPFKNKQRQDSVVTTSTVTKGSSTNTEGTSVESPLTMNRGKSESMDSARRKKKGAAGLSNEDAPPLTVITSRGTYDSPTANAPPPDQKTSLLESATDNSRAKASTGLSNVARAHSAGPIVTTTKTGTVVPPPQPRMRRSLSATIHRPKEPDQHGVNIAASASASVPPVLPMTYVDGSPIMSVKYSEPQKPVHSPDPMPTPMSGGSGVGIGFKRILSLFPGSFGSPQPTLTPETARLPLKEEGPQNKIFKKGELRCLEYSTLSDREMRRLEGRSDHRPVIGHFAVYI